jgi:cell pole-organizing protein PopZ
MNSKVKDGDIREEKLEDILRSIKGIIYNHNHSTDRVSDKNDSANLDESILELTTEFREDKKENSEFISKDTAEKFLIAINDFTKKIDSNYSNQEEKKFDTELNTLIKPMLKDWLDSNLPRLVEKVIAEELKKLMPKK